MQAAWDIEDPGNLTRLISSRDSVSIIATTGSSNVAAVDSIVDNSSPKDQKHNHKHDLFMNN